MTHGWPGVIQWAANERLCGKKSKAQTMVVGVFKEFSCQTLEVRELVLTQAGFHADGVQDDAEEHQYSERSFRLVQSMSMEVAEGNKDNLHVVLCQGLPTDSGINVSLVQQTCKLRAKHPSFSFSALSSSPAKGPQAALHHNLPNSALSHLTVSYAQRAPLKAHLLSNMM